MSVGSAIKEIERAMDKRIDRIASFRAIVTAVDGSRISIKRVGAATADTAYYASCSRFLLAVNDEVLCVMLGKQPVIVDRIGRAAAAVPTFTVQAAAGATASAASSTGNDSSGFIQLVPGGAGLATGIQLRMSFAVARPSTSFRVHLQAASSAARARPDVGPTGRATDKWDLTTDTILTGGSTYQWFYNIEQYSNT